MPVDLYDVARVGERWEIRPSAIFALSLTAMFGFGCALMAYFAAIVLPKVHALVGFAIAAGFLGVAGYSASLSLRAWRTRRTPLTILPGGRVLYGEKELCQAGAVRAVRVGEGLEAGDLEVSLILHSGDVVRMPHIYFAAFTAPALARPFAAKLAELLGVDVERSR